MGQQNNNSNGSVFTTSLIVADSAGNFIIDAEGGNANLQPASNKTLQVDATKVLIKNLMQVSASAARSIQLDVSGSATQIAMSGADAVLTTVLTYSETTGLTIT